MVLVILALGFLTSVTFTWTERYNKKQEIQKQLEETIALQRMFIDKWMNERSQQVQFLSRYASSHPIDVENMRGMFSEFLKGQNEISALVYLDSTGHAMLDSSGSPAGADLSSRDYFQEAKKGKSYVTDLMIGKTSPKPIVIFSSPIIDRDGTFKGLIFGSVSLSTIERIMGQFAFGRTGETYLLDTEGRMLTSPRLEGVIDYKLHHATQVYLAARAGKPVDSSYLNYQGEAVFGAYEWTKDNRWILVGEINCSEVYATLYRNIAFACGLVLLMLVVGYFMVRSLSKQIEQPIHYLLVGTKIMQEGNYDYRIAKEEIGSAPVELRQLCDMFNATAQKLESTIQLLEQTAVIDQLTAVYNRRFVLNEGSKMLETCIRAEQPCSVLMIDVDYFKKVNDTYGHLVGDRVIIYAASVLLSCIRSCDLVSRYGGEEFLIMAPNTNADEAVWLLAERIRCRFVDMPYREGAMEIPLTVSVGVADYHTNVAYGTNVLEDMISRADEALYRAKRAGRNRVER